jgi:hypothetical protein
MLNPKDVISQAQDKHKENLEWIEKESELAQALGTLEPRRKESHGSKVRRAIDVVQSLALLLIPGVDQKANR